MLTKATLKDDQGGEVRFQFNPETIKFTATAKLDAQGPTSDSQYKGPDPIELSLAMLLDEATATEPVLTRLETMMRWTQPKDDKRNSYVVTFTWGMLKVGSSVGLTCHCKSIDVEYQLFNPQGVPVRALVTIKLIEIPPAPRRQNPTSGGELPARSHVVAAGDDLAVLAHAEYGTTALWRAVACRNRIDNPFRLPRGRELIFPAQLELER